MMIFKTEKSIVTPSGLIVQFQPEHIILSSFFHSFNRSLYPSFLANVAKSEGFSIENVMLQFYHEMDWEDKEGLEIGPDDVSIYVYDGHPNELVLKATAFKKTLYDYGVNLLEVYRTDESLSPDWSQEMEKSLKELKSNFPS